MCNILDSLSNQPSTGSQSLVAYKQQEVNHTELFLTNSEVLRQMSACLFLTVVFCVGFKLKDLFNF